VGGNTCNTSTGSGNLLTPPAPQVFTYDTDGNLINDLVWTYTWDGENRLVGMENLTTLADTTARRKLVFEYDWQGRRIRKTVYPFIRGVGAPTAPRPPATRSICGTAGTCWVSSTPRE
jgi:hypothetical protein